jgi:hypothetical protein
MSSEEKRPEQSSQESEHDQYLICEKKQDPNTEHRRAQCLQKRREENKEDMKVRTGFVPRPAFYS